jgi:hypothetical protein
MSASKIELNPIYLNSKSIELLTEVAASDAKHDFDTFFLKIFSSIGGGKEFKEIGTSIILKDTFRTPPNEHPTLHKMLSGEGQTIIHGSPATNDRWSDTLFPAAPPFLQTSEKFILNPDLNPPSGTPTNEYILQTTKFNAPGFNAPQLFEFLDSNFGGQKKIYVQQDAGSISYNDKFLAAENPDSGPAGQYLFHYLNSREGQNDAAGKTTDDSPVVTKTEGKKVKVQILQEKTKTEMEEGVPVKKERQIIYTQLPNSSLGRTAPYTNNFNSIYNIEVSPIIYEEVKSVLKKVKKTARVSLYFRDEKNKVIGSTNKGKRENAVGTLTSILTTFLNKLLKKQKETAPYFQALQQKRGGDWFQCLATFDKERFGLTEKDTILLFTHDLICLAYALANGVNVLFSFSRGHDDKRIMLFKNTKTILDKGLISYLEEIENLSQAVTKKQVELETSLLLYAKSRKKLVEDFKTNITAVHIAFNEKLASLNDPSNVAKTVRELVRDLLKAYFDYSFFTNMFPSEQSFIGEIYQVTFPSAAADPIVTRTEFYNSSIGKFTTYKNEILQLLQSIIFDTATPPASHKVFFDKLKGKSRNTYTERNSFYKEVGKQDERTLLESLDASFTTNPGEKKKELNEKIRELESFVSSLYTLEKRLNTYKITVSSIETINITELINLTKKIKSKDIDAISVFLNNFNPIPLNLRVDAEGVVQETFRPKNRLSIFTNLGGRAKKTEIEEHNEKSEVDYSVFNYFIGNQLPSGMKGEFIAKLEMIPGRLETILSGIPDSGATSRKHKDLKATVALYKYFLNETKFHLDANTDWNYEMGLTTDILNKIHLLYKKPVTPVGVFEGGGEEKKEKVMIGGDIDLSQENINNITNFLIKTFPDFFANDDSFNSVFLDEFRDRLDFESGSMTVPLRKQLPSILEESKLEIRGKINDSEYNEVIYSYIDFLNSEDERAFTHIKEERNKINAEKIGEFILNPTELGKIISSTQIALIAANEASRIATAAKEAAQADAINARAKATAARAAVTGAAAPDAKLDAAANEAEAAALAAETARDEAAASLTALEAAKADVTTRATAVDAAVPAASASGAPPTAAEIAAAKEAEETRQLPPTKAAAITVSQKAKEVIEKEKLVAEKQTEATLAASKIDILIKKSNFWNFLRGVGAAVVAPPGPAAVGNGSGAAVVGAKSDQEESFEKDISDIFEEYIHEEATIAKEAIKDTKNENVLMSTPEALYLDILMRYRELYRTNFLVDENTVLDKPNEEFESLEEAMTQKISVFKTFLTRKYPAADNAARAAAEEARLKAAETARAAATTADAALTAAQGALTGGAREPFTINNVNVPFLGWITLYFYGLSLFQELEDTKHVTDGFDYPYLARQTQFFLSMEQSMYTHVRSKQKGGGGQGSPNQSTVITLNSNTNAITRVKAQKQYNSSLRERVDEITQVLKIYSIGNQCDLFLTNILPRLDFIESPEAQTLKKAIFDAMGIGEGYGWISYFSGIQNDFFFGQSMDSSLDSEVDLNDPYLQRFIQTTLETLKASPPYEFTDEAKYAAQEKIRKSLEKMIVFLNTTEHQLVKHMYQEILIGRAEEKQKTAQATRKIQTFQNQRKNRNTLTNEINKIMSYSYDNFCDLKFLIANRLVREEGKRLGAGPLTTEFDTQRHSRILQSIPNGLARFKAIEPKLQANPELKQKYIQRIKNLNTYGESKNREKYNSAFKALQSFLENPDNPGLLTGGTRKRKALRLKSRRRTHKKR